MLCVVLCCVVCCECAVLCCVLYCAVLCAVLCCVLCCVASCGATAHLLGEEHLLLLQGLLHRRQLRLHLVLVLGHQLPCATTHLSRQTHTRDMPSTRTNPPPIEHTRIPKRKHLSPTWEKNTERRQAPTPTLLAPKQTPAITHIRQQDHASNPAAVQHACGHALTLNPKPKINSNPEINSNPKT